MSSRFENGTRETQRTQLFGNSVPRAQSPYKQSTPDYSASMMEQLESQSSEEMGMMSSKIKQLKMLSVKMGDEIRGSNQTLDQLGDTFDATKTRLKLTFNRMMVMADRSGISIKMWLLIFSVIGLLFFWVWIR